MKNLVYGITVCAVYQVFCKTICLEQCIIGMNSSGVLFTR